MPCEMHRIHERAGLQHGLQFSTSLVDSPVNGNEARKKKNIV